jgi:transcriptional regulator GlxA family with amidase domain
MHAVVALALPTVEAFDLAIPSQVFGDQVIHADRYTFTVCAPSAGLVPSTAGYAIQANRGLEALADADTVVVPGYEWALEHLADPLTVADLARQAGWAPRTFSRQFVAETGLTPLRWLTAARVSEARRLLEVTDLPVEDVARRSGLGSTANLRVHLARDAGATPTAYRAAYRGRAPRSENQVHLSRTVPGSTPGPRSHVPRWRSVFRA